MWNAAKSLMKSNGVVNSLKDNNLYESVKTFRQTNAQQSGLSTVDRVLKNSADSKAYNAALAERSSALSSKIAKTDKDSIKGISLNEQLKVMKQAEASAKGMSDTAFNARKTEIASGDYKKQRSKEMSDALNPAVKKMGGAAKSYFTDASGTQLAARAGAAVGAYGVAAVGSRMLTGGSATTNNRGERDIAGIPFF